MTKKSKNQCTYTYRVIIVIIIRVALFPTIIVVDSMSIISYIKR